MGMGTGSATGIGAGAASTALADRRPPRVNENLIMKILRLDSFVTFRVRRIDTNIVGYLVSPN